MSTDHAPGPDDASPPDPHTDLPPAEEAAPQPPTGRTAVTVSVLLVVSSALGLLRDVSLAGLFGASGRTDAFLVAWMIPETVTVLLMEGAMSYLLVPVFVRELTRRSSVARVVRATLLPLVLLLFALTAVVVVAAPLLVDLLAPGLSERQLAIDCFRIAAATVLFMGLAGYLMAALRANGRFLTPASTYIAYNVGILGAMYLLHSQLGVISAALGLAVGSALMVAVQVPLFLRLTSLRGLRVRVSRGLLIAALAFVPTAGYSMGRQAQVFVERIVGSTLEQGAISHMNYASKVSQMASLLALTAAAVAFPSLARMAADREALRLRVEREFRRLVLLIAPGIAFLFLFAEPAIQVLFERGAFGPEDTAQTAVVMRVYCLGLLGQVLVSLGTYVCFGGKGRIWSPAIAAGSGLLVTIVLDVALAPLLGVVALAVGNAVGITVAAVVLWVRIRRRTVSFDVRGLGRHLGLLTPASAVSAAAAWLVSRVVDGYALAEVVLGGTLTLVFFLLLTSAAKVRESRELSAFLMTAGRRVRPGGGD